MRIQPYSLKSVWTQSLYHKADVRSKGQGERISRIQVSIIPILRMTRFSNVLLSPD